MSSRPRKSPSKAKVGTTIAQPSWPYEVQRCVERLSGWFEEIELEEPARQSGFVQRKPKKITPLLFLQAAIVLVSQSAVSLSRWAALLGVLGDMRLAKQSLWERINQGAVEFLQQILAVVIGQRVGGSCQPVPEALKVFKRVLIQDSTVIKLTAKLAAIFPGSSNQRGAKNGQLKIQAIYELLSQRFVSFGLSGFTRNDQAAACDVVPLIQPGDLVVRDLGYFVMESFQRIAQAGAFFLSRIRLDTTLHDPSTDKEFNVLGQLRRYGQLDQQVRLGSQRLPVRLVAIQLPPEVAAERRRKAKQNRDKRCKPNARTLALLSWAIFITNVPHKVCSAKTVAQIYSLRWRIETIFKVWKSHFRITEVPDGSQSQLLVVIYARLIFITVLAQVCGACWLHPWVVPERPPLSILKTAALLGDYFLLLFFEASNLRLTDALLLQIDYHGRYDRRSRENFHEKFTKLS